VDPAQLRTRVDEHIRRHDLIPAGGAILCLVSGGADSTCLWHALRELGYDVSALHVNHELRGPESEDDAQFCRDVFDAEVVRAPGSTESELRNLRYSFAADRLRATGHTASDQVETVLYRLVSSGRPGGIKVRREDRVVRPLLTVWREETEAYCHAVGLPFRLDSSNAATKRGLIREGRPSRLDSLLATAEGSARVDLGGGLQAVREYDRVWLERGPVQLAGEVRWGPWRISSTVPGLQVRGWRAGDRLAGRHKKLQDVFVDAKVPRSQREAWPLVVRGDEVVAVPGIVEAPGVKAERVAD
jgi:tRNA(Ile)-lysidine synthetase-like protein